MTLNSSHVSDNVDDGVVIGELSKKTCALFKIGKITDNHAVMIELLQDLGKDLPVPSMMFGDAYALPV